MSTPQNPLNAYNTYSYHQMLLVCDGTVTAEHIVSNEDFIDTYDHPTERFAPKRAGNGGQYIVLINGTTDAKLSIKESSWASVIIPRSGGQTSQGMTTQTMAVDGELVISEPNGVQFFNVLDEATSKLGVDASSLVFILKTIFVGHTELDVTDAIVNTRPIMFLMLDISATFDITGAEYTISFVGISNGAAKLPHMNSIATNLTFNFKPNIALAEALNQLQEKLNDHYNNYYNTLFDAAGACGDTGINRDEFREVRYEIYLADAYNEKTGDAGGDRSRYLAGTQSLPSEQNTGEGDAQIASLGTAASIEAIISVIMNSCKQVQEDDKLPPRPANAADVDPDQRYRRTFKITSDLKCTPDEYVVRYYVHMMEAVAVKPENLLTFEPPLGPDGNPQGLVLDYIFSGKNVDIIDFDLKMQYGLLFFQTITADNSLPTSASSHSNFKSDARILGGSNPQNTGSQQTESKENPAQKVKKPLFLGTTLLNPAFRNTRSVQSSSRFNTLMHKQAMIENLEAQVTIRGNPQLLEDTTQLPSDIRTIDPTSPTPIGTTEDNRVLFPSIHTVPAYVKINVYTPDAWQPTDPGIGPSQDFAKEFWYQGWYRVFEIKHIFDGDFKQELSLMSIPVDSGESQLSQCEDQRLDRLSNVNRVAGGGNAGTTETASDAGENTIERQEQKRQSQTGKPTGTTRLGGATTGGGF